MTDLERKHDMTNEPNEVKPVRRWTILQNGQIGYQFFKEQTKTVSNCIEVEIRPVSQPVEQEKSMTDWRMEALASSKNNMELNQEVERLQSSLEIARQEVEHLRKVNRIYTRFNEHDLLKAKLENVNIFFRALQKAIIDRIPVGQWEKVDEELRELAHSLFLCNVQTNQEPSSAQESDFLPKKSVRSEAEEVREATALEAFKFLEETGFSVERQLVSDDWIVTDREGYQLISKGFSPLAAIRSAMAKEANK